MDLSLPALLGFARDTVADPRAAARRVMALPVELRDRWAALVLTAVIATILLQIELSLMPQDALTAMMAASPMRNLAVQLVLLSVVVVLTWRIGVAWGGTGGLPATVSLVAWLQFILLIVQVAQVVAFVILPPLAALLGFAGLGLFFWVFTHFVAELHGFRSLGSTLAGILAVIFAVALILSALLAGVLPAPA